MIGNSILSPRVRQQAMDTIVLLVVIVLIWQFAYDLVGAAGLSSPTKTTELAYGMLKSENFWLNVYATFLGFSIALGISIILGLLIGLLLGLDRLSGNVLEPILLSLYAIPKIMLYPVILMVFGIGLGSEVMFGIFSGIVPIIIFTMNAVKNINSVYLKTSYVLRLNRLQLMWTIAIPAAMPEIFSGLRIGFASTIVGVLVSEMFGSRNGIGFMLMNAIALNNFDIIMPLTLLLVIFTATINGILLIIDNKLRYRS
jgi:NitT/TauT family transport system permease protein